MSSENSPSKQNENAPSEEMGANTEPLTSTVFNTALAGHQINVRLRRGDMIGSVYKVMDFLGSGGMSDVYMCEDLSLGRTIAVKTLKTGYSEDSLRRFQTEGKAIAKLEHPNIVKLYGLNTVEDGLPILLMEYVPGKTLAQLLDRDKALPLQRALKIASQIAEALKSAEKQGVIHRDLKPSNIMVLNPGSLDEKVKILDFGIAKIQGETSINATQTGEVFGTPKYMSPEQALGKKCDGRADQYAFGCILFEMLSGQPPFHAENAFSLMMAHVQDRIPSLSKIAKQPIPDHLDAVVTKLLQKEPADRYATMDDASKAIFESQSWKLFLPKILIGASIGCLLFMAIAVGLVLHDNSKPNMASVAYPGHSQKPEAPYKASLEPTQPSEADKQLALRGDELEHAQTLELQNQNVTDFGLAAIAKAKHLRLLNLKGNLHVTSKGLEKLKLLPLQSLNLDGTGINDEASKSIAQMATLKDLDLNNTDVTTETCKNLSGLPALRKLWLSSTGVDGRSLPYLSKLTSLRYLNLDNDDVAENLGELRELPIEELCLARIPNARRNAWDGIDTMKNLKILDLGGTNIDDEDLRRFVELPNIRQVFINDCKNITVAAATAIRMRRNVAQIFLKKGELAVSSNSHSLKVQGKELIQNGDFERPELTEQFITIKKGEPTLKNWNVRSGSIDLVGSFMTASGSNCVDLDGYHAKGTIEQTINTVSGAQYVLQFDATTHPDAANQPQTLTASVGDVSKIIALPGLENTRTHMNWNHFQLLFKAQSPRTRVNFECLSGVDQGACLDSVSVRKFAN